MVTTLAGFWRIIMTKKWSDEVRAAAIRAGAQLVIHATANQKPVKPMTVMELAQHTAEMADLILQFYEQQPSAKK